MRNRSSTQPQHIEAASCIKIRDTTIGAEELADVSSYQTLPADKNSKKLLYAHTKLVKKAGTYAPIGVKL